MSVEDSAATGETEGQVDGTQAADDQSESTESEQEEGQESPEVEVVHAGDEGSQPEKSNLGIRKRINKLNAKVSAAEHNETQASEALEVEKQRNKLLQLAVDQARAGGAQTTPKVPDTLDYEDGAGDPRYQAALHEYNQGLIDTAVNKRLASAQQNATTRHDIAEDDRELERRQTSHYQRADKLGVKDYAETEDLAIEALGRDNVNHLIRATDNSEALLYYLGKHPEKATHFADLIERSPVKAVFELGTLAAGLKIQPRANQNPAPDPDKDLEGATPTSTSDYERRLDKLRVKAQETGEIGPVLAFKKANREGATA